MYRTGIVAVFSGSSGSITCMSEQSCEKAHGLASVGNDLQRSDVGGPKEEPLAPLLVWPMHGSLGRRGSPGVPRHQGAIPASDVQ